MTKRIETALAVRRRLAKSTTAEATVGKAPTVLAPLAQVLGDVQHIVATELRFILADQAVGVRLEASDAKKIQALTTALANTVSVSKALSEDQLGEMSDEALDRYLAEQLAAERAAGRKLEDK